MFNFDITAKGGVSPSTITVPRNLPISAVNYDTSGLRARDVTARGKPCVLLDSTYVFRLKLYPHVKIILAE